MIEKDYLGFKFKYVNKTDAALDYYIKKFKDKNSDFNPSGIASFSRTFHKDECSESIKKANLLLNDIFLFNDPWDMEQCHIPYKLAPLKWDYSPNGDEEWIFMLNRHEYLYCLITAYYLTKEEVYIKKWIKLVISWIKENPMDNKSKCWRTIDTGIRCMSITLGLRHIISTGILHENEFLIIINSLFEQVKYLKDNFIQKYYLSNWGVLQTTGICTTLMSFYDICPEKEILDWAIDMLEKQLNFQVFEDGMQWEQSPMYHIEVLYSTLKTIYISKITGFSVSKAIMEKAYALSKSLIYSCQPNHHQIMQSDSDDTDVRDICTLAAIIFNDGELKGAGYGVVDFNTAWLLGNKAIEDYKSINKRMPKETSKAFEDGGNYYLRSSWSDAASFCYFHNGTLGSGHGHADLTHFNITAFGENFLIDPGRYTYVEGDPLRLYFKSSKAHNTVVIDDKDFTECRDSWSYNRTAQPLKNYHMFKEKVDYIEGSYFVNKNGIDDFYLVTRKLIYIKPSIWVISNIVHKEGEHIGKKYFHFDKDVIVSNNGNKTELRKNEAFMNIYHDSFESIKIKNDLMSTNYNKIQNSKTLISSLSFKDLMVSNDVIYASLDDKELNIKKGLLYQAGQDSPINENVATSIEIEISANERYIVILIHEEIFKGNKIMMYNNEIPVYGKTVLIHDKNGKVEYINLKS